MQAKVEYKRTYQSHYELNQVFVTPGGTNFRIFFCPNINPPKFWQIRNFFRPKFLVFRIFLKNELSVNFMIILPIHLIYQGTTTRCLPKEVDFPQDFDVTFTSNHCGNEEKSTYCES